jgi:hypothetical protein
MKFITFLILILSSTFVFSQTKIEIDTIEVNYRIKGVIEVTSQIPQIKGEINSIAKDKINSDIRKHFMASIQKDSAEYVSELLKEYELSTIEEYIELEEEQMPNDEAESFEITYISQNLLNFTYSYQILPYRGRYQFFFNSAQYDLRTGNKLSFDDFLTIEKDTLISIFRKDGYRIEWQSEPDTPYLIVPIDQYDEYVEKNIKYLFEKEEDDSCIEFYFLEKESELHLMFKFQCAGPQLQDYGISLKYLKPYIKYSDFKNRFKLWDNNIYSLIGYDYLTLGNEIEFQEYTLTNSGSGFLLSNNNKVATDEFGIIFCHSSTKTYYLFIKYQKVNDKKKAIITDILEIDKNELTGNLFTEYCETKEGIDSEIIALVKDTKDNPEYHTKIIKAWRANRKTGKFESIKKNKISRCGNESYGI